VPSAGLGRQHARDHAEHYVDPTTSALSFVSPTVGISRARPLTASTTCSSCFGNSVSGLSSPPTHGNSFETGAPDASGASGTSGAAGAAGATVPLDRTETAIVALLEQGAAGLSRLTPRTLEACSREGIEPTELMPQAITAFAPQDLRDKEELAMRHQRARYERYEARRTAKISDVLAARRELDVPAEATFVPVELGDASTSPLLEQQRRRITASQAAAERQDRLLEEKMAHAQATRAEMARRLAEVGKRFAGFELSRENARQAKAAAGVEKRYLQSARALCRKAELAAEIERRAAAAISHEKRRTQRMAAERQAQEAARHQQGQLKAAKIKLAQAERTAALARREDAINKVILERQEKVAAHAERCETARTHSVRVGIEKQVRANAMIDEVERQTDEFVERTRAKLVTSASGNSVRDELMTHRRVAQTERSRAVAAARAEVERAQERYGKALVQEEERKERKREAILTARAEAKADAAEQRRAHLEEVEERLRRQAKRLEHDIELRKRAQNAEDAKLMAQREHLERMQQQRMALKQKMMADTPPSMREIDGRSEPGPTTLDNRFMSTGELGPNGKYGRVGTMKAPPAYSFGSLSETSLPRVLDKSMMVEIVGLASPGPGTASPRLGSRDVLDKTNQYRRSPSWSIGHLVDAAPNKEALSRPGPGETHVSDRQLQLTRYKSAPGFSFASSRYQELHKRELAAKNSGHKPSTAEGRARRSREPGPMTYDLSRSTTSLSRHRNIADGNGVSQRFGSARRFIPLEDHPKDEFAPFKYAKSQSVPGPQKYRPSTSYLSTPLSF
jgi:hypothetical protein